MRPKLRCAAALLFSLPLLAQKEAELAPAGTAVLHTGTRLVVVDITVTDSSGAPVHSLPKSSFHLEESGHAQTLLNVEEHSATLKSTEASPPPPPLQPDVFSNLLPVSPQNPPTVLLLDALNTPMQNQSWMREKLLDYLRTAPPDQRLAICVLNSRLVVLQNLTTDPALLRAALEHARPKDSPMGNSDAYRGMDLTQIPDEARGAFIDPNGEWTNLNEDQRADISLHAFHQLAQYLAGIPGRKNLIWFSSAFPLNLLPRGRSRFRGDPRWEGEYRETIDSLTRSRVAIYPVDARGLMQDPITNPPRAGIGIGAANTLGGVTAQMKDVRVETQSAMYDMANDTGGKAFVNTNGITQAIAEVVAGGSEYYTLTYKPPDANMDGGYRAIHVDVDQSRGYKLSYRRGYYADATEPAGGVPKTATAEASPTRVQSAAAYFAPISTQIPFYARVLSIPEGVVNVSETSHQKRDPTDNRRYSVEYSVDLRDITTTTTPDGQHHAHVEFIAVAYNSQGKIIRSDARPVTMTWTAEQYAAVLQHGARYAQQVALPANGLPTLRLFVHDLSDDHLGSLDVPAVALKQ